MDIRHTLCLCFKYARCDWIDDLAAAGWAVHRATDLHEAHRLLREIDCRVGVIAVARTDAALFEELDGFMRSHGTAEWVGLFEPAVTGLPIGRDLVVEHLFDHLTVPVDPQRLAMTIGHAWGRATLRRASRDDASHHRDAVILGTSAANLELLRQIRRVAKVDAPVLICGESGSGKELAAQAIHRHSARSVGPFVPVNCGAIQPTLIQSELFGHVKGAFTGATADGRGLIEASHGGTIFLDEIGDLSIELQINLLRFLQEKTINRVGSTRSIRVDTRVIAATHVNLEEAVAAGSFREDLYYRLNVVPMRVPALRERASDIVLLAEHYLEQFAKEKGPRLKGFNQRALAALAAHAWPGNVRELINRVRRAAVMAEGQLITPQDLGLQERDPPRDWEALEQARLRAERGVLMSSLAQAGRNVTRAARQLGISRMTLYRLMAKHGLDAEQSL